MEEANQVKCGCTGWWSRPIEDKSDPDDKSINNQILHKKKYY